MKQKLLDRAKEILDDMGNKEFEDYAIDWLGWDRICDDFWDSWNNTDHEIEELANFINQHKKK